MNSKRLLAIASLINKDDSIVDIGCDHGYLDIYLIKNKLYKKAIASDISENALSQAKANIEKYNLTKKIDTVVSNGLENIDVKDINTVVISGMGTSTILNILDNPKVDSINKFIIQSNNNLEELRTAMNKRNYKIIKEIVVYEKGKYYTIIEFVHGKEKLSTTTKLLGAYNKDNIDYYKYLYDKYKGILNKIPKYKLNKIFSTLHIVIKLQKYIIEQNNKKIN